jgi:glutaredoxin
MAKLELYGTACCPYTGEMREWLEWSGKEFEEFDVDADEAARARMKGMATAPYTVPILVEDGKIKQVGWQGRGCVVAAK